MVRWIVLIVLVVTATVFIIRNFERVEIDWVFPHLVGSAVAHHGRVPADRVGDWLADPPLSSRAQRRRSPALDRFRIPLDERREGPL
ncbi:MAG: hypothetical protein R2855_13455 [Thermomicrobiales bacterium]